MTVILGYPGAKFQEPYSSYLYSCFINNEFLHLQSAKFQCGPAGKDSCRARQNQLRAIKFRFDRYGWPAESFDLLVPGVRGLGSLWGFPGFRCHVVSCQRLLDSGRSPKLFEPRDVVGPVMLGQSGPVNINPVLLQSTPWC